MNNIFKIGALASLLILSNSLYSQQKYYVSKNGNDVANGRSIQTSWKTIQKAANELQAGDTVFILGGIYNEIVQPQNSGTLGNHIVYTAYNQEEVVVDGSNLNDYLSVYDRAVFDIKNRGFITLKKVSVRNSVATGVAMRYGSNNISIIDCKISNCKAPGIAAGYNNDGLQRPTNFIITGNSVDSCSLESRESISVRNAIHFLVKDNTVLNTPKEGIDAKSGCSEGVISHNYLENIGAVGIYLDAGYPDPSYLVQDKIYVFSNILKNTKNGIAIASERGVLGKNMWVYNNLIFDNNESVAGQGNGIMIANFEGNGPLDSLYILNNTIVGKGHRGFYINTLNVTNVTFCNNLLSQNSICQVDYPNSIQNIVISNNLLYGINCKTGQNAQLSNPLFRNALQENFRLLDSSPALSNGLYFPIVSVDLDGNYREDFEHIDIGAYQFTESLSSNKAASINEFIIYPNPSSERIQIGFPYADFSLTILDLKGSIVYQGENAQSVDVSKLETGIYVVSVQTSEIRRTQLLNIRH